MIRRPILLLALALLPLGCAGLPALVPVPPGPERDAALARCRAPFVEAPFRAVHTIAADLPLDNRSDLVGVTVADPATGRLRAVLLSVEGLTLFDASVAAGQVSVHRAVPPLDEPDFGPGLAGDVTLALMPPAWPLALVGRDPAGALVCRHRAAAGDTLDVRPGEGAAYALERYDADEDLIRTVAGQGRAALGLAGQVLLSAPGLAGYTLRMILQEAEPITPADDLFLP